MSIASHVRLMLNVQFRMVRETILSSWLRAGAVLLLSIYKAVKTSCATGIELGECGGSANRYRPLSDRHVTET